MHRGLLCPGKPHPRLYGSFARVLGRYARKEGVLTLEEAVRKMTGKAAQVLSLRDRGLIQEACTPTSPSLTPPPSSTRHLYRPDSIPRRHRYVIVNGEVAVDHGAHTGALNGRVIRRGR
mgnify:CR=1 FL=1